MNIPKSVFSTFSSVIVVCLAIFITSLTIRTGIDLTFGIRVSLAGICCLTLSMVMVKSFYFDKG